MKINSFLFLILFLLALVNRIGNDQHPSDPIKIDKLEFQHILDSTNLVGAILIYDLKKDTYYSNDFELVESQHCPASTFKIPNTLIALELGVIKDETSIFSWDGQIRNVNNWNQDLTFKQAFHYSCVPCYQEIARQIGAARMDSLLRIFNYGKHFVDSSNIDIFWLEGDSRISQMEQIEFLRKFHAGHLNLSDRTDRIAKQMMIAEEGPDYKLIAKTGLSLNGDGWYVGYIEKEENTYFFATYLKMAENSNYNLRKEVTHQAFDLMSLISDRP